ncbi:hypothetical protein LCGC14_2475380, partial [marine sediment metagenome]
MTTQDQEMDKFAFFLRYPPEVANQKRRPKGDSTVSTYVYIARRFLAFLDGSTPDQEGARRFVIHLEEIGNTPRTRAQHIYGLRSYFEFKGEVLGIGAPTFSKPLPWRPTDEEWLKLLEVADSPLWDKALQRILLRPNDIPSYQRVDTAIVDPADRPSNREYDRYAYLVKVAY